MVFASKNRDVGKRIKQLRLSLNLTLEKFARKAELSSASFVRGVEEGLIGQKKGIGTETILRICKTFGVNPTWLLTGEDRHNELPCLVAEPHEEYGVEKLSAIRVVNDVPAGYPEIPCLEDEVRDYVYVPNMPKGAFGLYVQGDSMTPELNDKDVVVVNPTKRDFASGELGVFRLTTGATVKYYYKEGDSVWLQPKNPKYPPIILTDELECIAVGKVVCKIIMIK